MWIIFSNFVKLLVFKNNTLFIPNLYILIYRVIYRKLNVLYTLSTVLSTELKNMIKDKYYINYISALI
jgi:hypothetical protein